MFNFQYQKHLIHRLSCIIALKIMMSVWIINSKNIFLKSIGNMESLIRANTEKDPVKENGHTENIMFRIMLMLHTNL